MPLLDLFWTMLWFFLFFAWLMLLFRIFGDIFRSEDMGGWAKAFWIIFVIVLPLLGVLVYVIARGSGMAERDVRDYKAVQAAQEDYIRSVAGSGGASTADQLEKLAALHDAGKLTDQEFQSQKAALLS